MAGEREELNATHTGKLRHNVLCSCAPFLPLGKKVRYCYAIPWIPRVKKKMKKKRKKEEEEEKGEKEKKNSEMIFWNVDTPVFAWCLNVETCDDDS